MFKYCSSLEILNLYNFNTKNVKDLSSMFAYCINIKILDLTALDIGKVTDMSSLFRYMISLTENSLLNFDNYKLLI